MPYLDAFNRPISYLRISVTDRCNLRCLYCMPPQGIRLRRHQEMLSYEEIITVVQAAADLGVTKVRLTGGEPLARLGLTDLVAMIAAVPGIDDLAMTTNGTLLARHARALAEAGLRRVNISLDTLRPERFRQITRRGDLAEVMAGIEAAQAAGLHPIKTNMVVLRGLNDDEVVDFARLTLERAWHVRYIERMPVGESQIPNPKSQIQNPKSKIQNPESRIQNPESQISNLEVRVRIEEALGSLEPASVEASNGPARYYRLAGARGTIGFISPLSECFCEGCNRLRLTADGRLRPCLLSDEELDLRTPLRAGATREEIGQLIARAIRAKPQGHRLAEWVVPVGRSMSEIGG